MKPNITKMIIPAGGIGSRFLPITKSIPKEMLPLSNKPAIEHIVQEGADAGINNMLIILSPQKGVIIDYFSRNHQLEQILAQNNKSYYLDDLNRLLATTNFQYFIQNQPLGIAHALEHIKPAIGNNEFFAMAYPDDIIFGPHPEIGNLIKVAQKHKAMVIGVMPIAQEKVCSYGVIDPLLSIDEHTVQIKGIVEKPHPNQAPSNLIFVGRVVLHSDIFSYLAKLTHTQTSEALWFDALHAMINDGYKVLAYKIQGQRFDTGTPAGWMEYIIQQHTKK